MIYLLFIFISLSIIYYLLCKKVKFFSFDGRISRADYWTVFIFVYSLFFFPYMYCLSLLELSGMPDEIMSGIMILGFVFYRALRIPIDVRRCHDINYSGWHSILLLIPILSLLVLLSNFFRKGTDGINKYD